MTFEEMQNSVENAWLGEGFNQPANSTVNVQATTALQEVGAYAPSTTASWLKPWTDLGASFLDSAASAAMEFNKQLPNILTGLALRKVSGGSESGGSIQYVVKPTSGVQPNVSGPTVISPAVQQAGISTGEILVIVLAGVALFLLARGLK